VKDLDAEGALRAGGWDPRYARVLAITARDDVAAVLVDSNGDGVDVDLDQQVREPDGTWQERLSGCVDDGVCRLVPNRDLGARAPRG
jgi:hypothetical protein